MNLNIKQRKYPIFIRLLHWLMAIIILSLIAVGWYMSQLPEDAENRSWFYGMHKSFGVLILLLWPLRATAISIARKPAYYGLSDQQIRLASAGHLVLYLLILLVPISGYLMSVANGYTVKLFNYPLPNLIAENEQIAEYAHLTHEYLPWVLLLAIGVHLAATIRHHLYDKVNVLNRML